MTSQTKVFLDPSDIVALRLECKQCGATLTLALSGAIEAKKLRTCPHCNNPWTMMHEKTIEPLVEKVINSLSSLNRSMDESGFPWGCSLTLEIKNPTP
jgi:hypothetical protein